MEFEGELLVLLHIIVEIPRVVYICFRALCDMTYLSLTVEKVIVIDVAAMISRSYQASGPVVPSCSCGERLPSRTSPPLPAYRSLSLVGSRDQRNCFCTLASK